MTGYSDFRTNLDLGFDRAIRCHENFDFLISVQGDLILTLSDTDAIIQKLFLWMAIKEGEVPNEPDLGCCIYKYFYKRPTLNNLLLLAKELEYQLKTLIPELGTKSVSVASTSNDYGKIDSVEITIISQDYGKINLTTNQMDLEDMEVVPAV